MPHVIVTNLSMIRHQLHLKLKGRLAYTIELLLILTPSLSVRDGIRDSVLSPRDAGHNSHRVSTRRTLIERQYHRDKTCSNMHPSYVMLCSHVLISSHGRRGPLLKEHSKAASRSLQSMVTTATSLAAHVILTSA